MKLPIILAVMLAPAFAYAADLKPGTFTCDGTSTYSKVQLRVSQHPTKPNKAILNWEGRDRIVHREPTQSGAVRYEGAGSNLLYIQTPHHSVLLNHSTMNVILSECVK